MGVCGNVAIWHISQSSQSGNMAKMAYPPIWQNGTCGMAQKSPDGKTPQGVGYYLNPGDDVSALVTITNSHNNE